MNWLGRLFAKRRRAAKPDLYRHLVDLSLGASSARMADFPPIPEWGEAEIAAASVGNLCDRWLENRIIIQDEYPETKAGTYRALRENLKIEVEMAERGCEPPRHRVPMSIHDPRLEKGSFLRPRSRY